jgi:hypothetical protein
VESSQVLVGVCAIVMTLFALVLALAVVTLDESFRDAGDSVQNEANSLAEIVHDVRVFPTGPRLRVDAAVRSYANEVRVHEFAAMRKGRDDPAAARSFDRLVAVIQSLRPATNAQKTFFDAGVRATGRVLDERHRRLVAATGSLPEAFWVLILLTGGMGLATTVLLRVESIALEVIMVASVGIVVGAGILTTLLLDYPFSGSVAVSGKPFAAVSALVSAP